MNMVALDTLAYAKRLQEAGVPPAQAEAHAIAQADFLTHYLLSEVATKTDLAGVKAELKSDLAEVKAELKSDIADVKAEIAEVKAELKSDIADVKVEIAEVKAELKSDIAEVKAELKSDIAEVKAEITEMKINMAEMETRLTLRMLFMVGILATLMTVFKFMG